MMKFTNTVFNNANFMKTLEKINDSEGLPGKVAFGFYLLSKKLDERNQAFHKIRIKLLEKYGTPDENKENYSVEGENLPVFQAEFTDLMNEPFEFDFEKFPYEESLNLTPAEMYAMESIFDYSNFETE